MRSKLADQGEPGMKLNSGTILWTFLWSIFMGITVGSIGIGAAFPAANLISAPFVCSGGHLELTTQDYNPTPVEQVTTLTWYCADERTGARQEVSIFRMALIVGPIYGLLLFMVIMAVLWIRENRKLENPDASGSAAKPRRLADLLQRTAELRASPEMSTIFTPQNNGETLEQRLAELKRLRDSDLISEQEYTRTKAKILNEL